MEYVRKFLPSKEIITVMKNLVEKIELPSYATPEEQQKFAAWKQMQTEYANTALKLHDLKIRSQIALRALVLGKWLCLLKTA